MINEYTTRFVKSEDGFIGQIVEWPDIVSKGRSLEDCRDSLGTTLKQMIQEYVVEGRAVPESANAIFSQVSLETR